MHSIGSTVYFLEPWNDNIVHGTVSERVTSKCGATVLTIQIPHFGTLNAFEHDCFDSLEECKKHEYEKENSRVEDIKNSIHSIEDLVLYMYNNPIALIDGYTDWAARRAVRERMKELLGIEVE